ncbi:MAG: hypothetical protein IJU00_04770 [Selenomonas sp.]|nr:hypothetical protein [Selenomonas sp.]
MPLPGKVMLRVEAAVDVEKIMVSVKEFAAISGLSERGVRRLSHIDSFPCIRAGWKILIHRKWAEAWLADFASREGSGACPVR